MNSSDLRDALRRDAELVGEPPSDLLERVEDLRRRSTRLAGPASWPRSSGWRSWSPPSRSAVRCWIGPEALWRHRPTRLLPRPVT